MILWHVDVIGGPYDGATGLSMALDTLPPDELFIFTCRRGEYCQRHHRVAHTWLAAFREDAAPNAVPYSLTSHDDAPPMDDDDELYPARAVYGRGDFEPLDQGEQQVRAKPGAPVAA